MWRIYYDGRETQTGHGKGPTGDLARGVQVIIQDHPTVGVELVTACDYYVLHGERWHGVDIFGLFDYLLDSGIVLFGRTISREEYAEIFRQAAAAKAGWLPREVRPNGSASMGTGRL